jgi:MFS transporter, ACDE family, multidrug resistance protein
MKEESIYRNSNLWIACTGGLLFMMMATSVVPAFPLIIRQFNISEQEVGLVISALTIPLFVLGWIGGILTDWIGRKRIFVWTLILYGVFGVACAFATDFKWLLILRMLQGICSAPSGGLTAVILSDIFSGNKRNEALGFSNTSNYAGYVIFPVLGGLLAGISWNAPFWIYALAIPMGIVGQLFLKTPEPKQTQSLAQYFQGTLHYLRSWRVVWLFLATTLTYLLLYGAFLTYFTIMAGTKFQGNPVVLGSFVSVLGLFTAFTSLQVGRISKRLSSVALVIIGFVFYGVATAIVPFVNNIWLCLVPVALFGIGHGLNLPALMEIASKVTPLEHRAGFMAIMTTMIPLGMTLGAPLMGLIYGLTSLDFVFYIGGLIALVPPLLAIFIRKR